MSAENTGTLNVKFMGNDTCMIMEPTGFVIVVGTKRSGKFSIDNAIKIVKTVTGFEVAKLCAKIRENRKMTEDEKNVYIPMNVNVNNGHDATFTIWHIKINTTNTSLWETRIWSDRGIITLADGMTEKIVKILVNKGIECAKSVGNYNKILFVDGLPTDHLETIDPKRIYVLTRPWQGKPTNTNWHVVNGKWEEFAADEYIS